ncbi:tyrosine-type recombinase/integrase [Falsiroseomonas tokyonensis]|uniref:Tyrosine-type recombinase/integrase n=1 Tax=Falsiroseomonas tokyonensis TaxID=430521 RepID=A0ABV7C3J2_9PROT|nr:site-specific integrase [Falsiroseomonas tokyonensis]MBU8540863.1 site-specific integrase [Falsiroseomonas tokyonensis]
MREKLYRGWWYAVWREDGRTHRRALRTQDHDAAKRALKDYAASLAAPKDTVAGIYAAYLADKGTERARWAWVRLEPHFGHMRPDQIGRPASRAYRAARETEGAGVGTIHTEMTYLRAALRWHDKATPAVVELPRKPAPKSRHITREEYDRLVDAAKSAHVRLFIILALATAGRMAAVLELKWEQVDLVAGIVRLGDGTRMRKGRATVPLTTRAVAAMAEAATARTSEYVIEWGGGKVGKIRKGFAAAAEAAGLPWVTPHVLRHTAAVWMAERGVPMAEIGQFLGHSDERTTYRIYARFSPHYLRGAASALE